MKYKLSNSNNMQMKSVYIFIASLNVPINVIWRWCKLNFPVVNTQVPADTGGMRVVYSFTGHFKVSVNPKCHQKTS